MSGPSQVAGGDESDGLAEGPRVVALGGGHGLAVSLSALRGLTRRLSAVVTVADDGGSSGRLRTEFGVLPPGDLRQALAALCGDDEWGRTWARVLQHRFASDGPLHGHALGNLLIVALWELLGERASGVGGDGGAGRGGSEESTATGGVELLGERASGAELLGEQHVNGLEWVARLLGAQGRVLPMSSVPLEIVAEVDGLDPEEPDGVHLVRGQAQVATTTGRVRNVRLVPPQPPPCPYAVEAVRAADAIILGPGSWFTSVLPHLMVPALRAAVQEAAARRIVTLNLVPQDGETQGFSPERHLEVLAAHAPELRVDVVVADEAFVDDRAALEAAAGTLGAELVVADIAMHDGTPRHDPIRLGRVYADVLA